MNADGSRRFLWGILGVAAAGGAAALLFIASFPYWFAESGSQSYARAHRAEAVLQVVGAVALLWVARKCMRRSFRPVVWVSLATGLIAITAARSFNKSREVPAGVTPAGGDFHVVTVPQPGEIDTVYYHLYHKRAGGYESIEELVGEFRFVEPDCMLYRGLQVVGRPMYAMCGYRVPVETYDTMTADSDLLSRARAQSRYRPNWRSAR